MAALAADKWSSKLFFFTRGISLTNLIRNHAKRWLHQQLAASVASENRDVAKPFFSVTPLVISAVALA